MSQAVSTLQPINLRTSLPIKESSLSFGNPSAAQRSKDAFQEYAATNIQDDEIVVHLKSKKAAATNDDLIAAIQIHQDVVMSTTPSFHLSVNFAIVDKNFTTNSQGETHQHTQSTFTLVASVEHRRSMSSSSAAGKDGVVAAAIINTTVEVDLSADDQACVVTAQCDAATTCALKSTSLANNPSEFVTMRSCVTAVEIKNAAVIVNSTTSLWSAIEAHKVSALVVNENQILSMDGVYNSTAHDTSKPTSNLATQGNFIASSLDSRVDGGMVRPPKYILALSSTANAKRKGGKTPLIVCETMLGNETMWSPNPPLDNNLMHVDDDPIISYLSNDVQIMKLLTLQ
ncbi:hypothetical protein ACH5RR_007379 [Cinchona calisaya]|uniref:Uncharacterized protein n=1 Tax=Cinchona calisaya TaxID=153742 RepID=A0ABD3ARM4_9GENT